jgi:hypothetical protein
MMTKVFIRRYKSSDYREALPIANFTNSNQPRVLERG